MPIRCRHSRCPEVGRRSLGGGAVARPAGAVLLVAMLVGWVSAADAGDLVSNVGQVDAGNLYTFGSHDIAQSFTTGSETSGYRLTSVEVRLADSDPETAGTLPTVKVYAGSAAGTVVATLTPRSVVLGTGPSNVVYDAPSDVTLAAGTEYWVVAEGGSADVRWVATDSTSTDSTSASDWTVATRGQTRTATESGSFSAAPAAVVFELRINGSAVTPPDPSNLVLGFGAGTPATGVDIYGRTFDVYLEINADIPESFGGNLIQSRYITGGSIDAYEFINERLHKFAIAPDPDTELVTLAFEPRQLCTVSSDCGANYRVAGGLTRTFGVEQPARPVSIEAPERIDEGTAATFTIRRTWSDRPARIPVTYVEREARAVTVSEQTTVLLDVGQTSAAFTYLPERKRNLQVERLIEVTFADSKYFTLSPSETRWVLPINNVETVPGAVSFGYVAGFGPSVYLSWSLPDDGGSDVFAYQVRWKKQSEAFTEWRNFPIADPGAGDYLRGLENSTTYTVEVRAVNDVGAGPATATTATTTATPGRPPAFTATAGDRRVALEWQASPTAGVTHYELRWNKAGEAAGQWRNIGNVLSYEVTGLDNQKLYAFAVRASSAEGNSSQNTVSAVPSPAAPPPEVRISGPGTVEEGSNVEFVLTRVGDLNSPLNVPVTVSESGDMIAVAEEGTKTVAFVSGSASASLTVLSEDDGEDEDDSTVTAAITANPSSYTLAGGGSATAIVEDDDYAPTSITVELVPPRYVEGSTSSIVANFYLEGPPRRGRLDFTVRVRPGSATAADYDTGGTGEFDVDARFAAGSRTAAVTLSNTFTIVDDNIVESDETITISGSTDAQDVEFVPASLVIVDNDSTDSSPDTTAPVLQTAEVDGTSLKLTFNETLGAAPTLATTAFTLVRTPAGGSEETLAFTGSPSVSGTSVTLTLANAVSGSDSGLLVSYDAPDSGSNNKIVDGAGNAVADFSRRRAVNKAAYADAPLVNVQRSKSRATEGQPAEFVLVRGTKGTPLTLDIRVTETGRTLSGAVPTQFTFPANSTRETLSLPTVDDAVNETDSIVTVRILDKPGSYRVVHPNSQNFTIEDNDERPARVDVEVDIDELTEGRTSSIKIAFSYESGALDRDAAITWQMRPGTAEMSEFGGANVFTPNVSTIPAGGSKSPISIINVTVFDDDLIEGNETIRITGTTDVPGLEVVPAVIVISDNDNSPPVFRHAAETRHFMGLAGGVVKTVGAPVVATDPDGDIVHYSLEGRHSGMFLINETTGQILTRADSRFSLPAEFSVTVIADDVHGNTARVPVTIVGERARWPNAGGPLDSGDRNDASPSADEAGEVRRALVPPERECTANICPRSNSDAPGLSSPFGPSPGQRYPDHWTIGGNSTTQG